MDIHDLIQAEKYSEALVMIDSCNLENWKKEDLRLRIYFALQEFENIESSIKFLRDAGQDVLFILCKAGLYEASYFLRKGLPNKSRQLLKEMNCNFDNLDEANSDELEVLAYYYHLNGTLYLYEGNNIEAEYHLLKSKDIKIKLDDFLSLAQTLNNLGGVYLRKGMFHVAIEYYNKALEIFEKLGNKNKEAITKNNLADLYSVRGELNIAKKYMEDNLVYFTDTGNKEQIGRTLSNLGETYYNFGDFDYAVKLLEESLEFRIESGNSQNIFNTYYMLSLCLIETDDKENLEECFKELEYYYKENPTLLNEIRLEFSNTLKSYYEDPDNNLDRHRVRLEKIISGETVDPFITFQTTILLIQTYFSLMIKNNDETYFDKINLRLDEIEKNSKKTDFYIYNLKSKMFKAKLKLVIGDFDEAEMLYQKAIDFASQHDLTVFKEFIQKDLENTKIEINNLGKNTKEHSSVIEKIEKSMISDYMRNIKNVIEKSQVSYS